MTNARIRSPNPILRMDQDIETHENAFTYPFGELRIGNLESTKHPRHPFLLDDKYATLLSLYPSSDFADFADPADRPRLG